MLRRIFSLPRILPWLALGMLGGCASQAPQRSVPALSVPAQFKHVASLETGPDTEAAVPTDRWWTAFSDPVLNGLVERGNQGNTSIQLAATHLAFAQAQARHAHAGAEPALSLNAGASRQTGPLLNAAGEEGTLFTLGASVSYELDVWGRLAQSDQAASLDVQSREALLHSARLLAQVHVAQTYLQIRATDQDLDWLQQKMQTQHQVLQISQYRFESGSVSALDLERLRDEADALQSERLVLLQRRMELENALASLLGEPASGFRLERAQWSGQLPAVRPGLPASVLARRPDVAATQFRVAAAYQRLGASQTAWLPSLALTGAAGYASAELGTLFSTAMQSLVLGALAKLPLLDGGRRDAATAMAEADFQTATLQHKEQVLLALREVEDQLSASRSLAQQFVLADRAVLSAKRRVELTDSSYRSGLSSRQQLLDNQNQLLSAQRRAAQVRASQYQTNLALVLALGGGWN